MVLDTQRVEKVEFSVRRRRRPPPRAEIYGDYVSKMVRDSKYFRDIRDRAAYVYITGQLPSHLRPEYTGALVHFSQIYRKPASLDGRTGVIKLSDDVAADLTLELHPMVKAVRHYMREGYLIQPSRGFGTRNGYHSIFLFRLVSSDSGANRITVKLDGAVKRGWGD